MNKDAEAMKQFLAWLLQEPDPAILEPSGETPGQETPDPMESGAVDLQCFSIDSLDSATEVDLIDDLTDVAESGACSAEEISPLAFGEIPAVQDRFHTLLKRRLRAEIERKPPLFPWETELYDYDAERSDWHPDLLPTPLWTAHLRTLNLPIPMPDSVLETLFEQCRTLLQSSIQTSMREGRRLVQAVESLFPGEAIVLNQLAGMVLTSPSRSGTLTRMPQTDPAELGFPTHYDQANLHQQMALSLLAAREIFEAMTLRLSTADRQVERSWLTGAGLLRLDLVYLPDHQLQVQVELPCGGKVQFQGQGETASAERTESGDLTLKINHLEQDSPYFLMLELVEGEAPLTFTVYLTDESLHP